MLYAGIHEQKGILQEVRLFTDEGEARNWLIRRAREDTNRQENTVSVWAGEVGEEAEELLGDCIVDCPECGAVATWHPDAQKCSACGFAYHFPPRPTT